jgi:hypothetical protein
MGAPARAEILLSFKRLSFLIARSIQFCYSDFEEAAMQIRTRGSGWRDKNGGPSALTATLYSVD